MEAVRKILGGLLALVVIAVIGYVALALFVALVNTTSGAAPEDPPYSDDGAYEDYLNQRGRELTDEYRRQQCEDARADNPDLVC